MAHVARVSCALVAFALPFHGFGALRFSDYLGASPVAFVYVAAAPWLLVAAVRERARLRKHSVVLAVLAFALVQMLSNSANAASLADLRSVLRDWVFAIVVTGTGAVTVTEKGRRVVERALVVGGAIAVTVSLLGYIASIAMVHPPALVAGFHFTSPNVAIGGLPRLTGTSGGAPEHHGEYLVLLTAVLLSARASRKNQVLLLGAVVALALTLSWAWLGGLVLAAHVLRERWRARAGWLRALPIVFVTMATLLFTLAMNLGAPRPLGSHTEVDCASLDTFHDVIVLSAGDGPRVARCRPVTITWPYVAPLKRYLEAKRASLALFAAHPWRGVGEAHFGDLAETDFAERHHAAAREQVVVYRAPHCLYLGAGALYGVLGFAAVLFLVGSVLREGRRRIDDGAAGVYFAATLAFLLIGLNIDILEIPFAWVCLGLFVGTTGHQPQEKAIPRRCASTTPSTP